MSQLSATIAKQPQLAPAEDFYRLRREGIGFIEQMGSRLWTDYNVSDSGIAIHEALCYAITDLAYRTGWDIRDILAPATPSPDQSKPFPNQPFYTARAILTVNPWTEDDFRRLLIDLETVRNAWIVCKECACDTSYYAWCEQEGLALSYQPPEGNLTPVEVWPLGLYEALLELESDPDTGDLNDRKIEATAVLSDAAGNHSLILELRFQEVSLADRQQWALFLDSDDAFAERNGQGINLKLIRFGATKTYDVQSDQNLDEQGRNDYLRRHWRNIFYASFEIELIPSGTKIVLQNAALRLFGSTATRDAATVQHLKAILEERTANGLIQRYRKKERLKAAAVVSAKVELMAHRNLDEDFCRVKVIDIEEIAVCADVEVTPDVDIERVQAQIWFEIEQYLNPPVPFYSLQELLDQGMPVEEIFNGPELESGFLKQEDLEAATLKSVLCVSDLINRLMDIEGVIAVNQLQLTKYDSEGNVVKGAADPTWSSDGKPSFDPDKVSASWLLYLARQHQPRLYRNASRFLFYKNGLPFLPRMDEALDTLTQLRGEAERSRIRGAVNDLAIPAGQYRDPEEYFPVQYSFPLTYGLGPDQLPTTASARRRAQARQLKAYLMVFEQILANAFAQLAHTADLFSLDPAVDRTYFVRELTEQMIQGYALLVTGLNKPTLEGMLETVEEFRQRRNRFLDHLLARFGEDFSEYGLLLAKLLGQQVALEQLIKDKIAFLVAYPEISHDRGKAFDYRHNPCAKDNQPGIEKRISLLLGYPDLDKRMIVVEHLLLRPKFPGDALFPACSEGTCTTCGEEDPYSFRLSFVMPGWLAPFNTDLEMRNYADRAIRQEVPSHLVAKICWVGWQFERFEAAWCQWLELNATFDWTEERLEERVEAILTQNLLSASAGRTSQSFRLCNCARAILTGFGMEFYQWMDGLLRSGSFTPDTPLPTFPIELPPACDGLNFQAGTMEKVRALLEERYHAYREVSYRLRVVVNLLSELINTYPAATLHDCDEGNDKNPVRLGTTSLGS